MQLSTTDQAAVSVLLSGASQEEKQSSINNLLVASNIAHGLQCPDCEATEVSDNGLLGADLTFLCESCGHQWSPNI